MGEPLCRSRLKVQKGRLAVTAAHGMSVCIPTHAGRSDFVCELLDTVTLAASHMTVPVEILVVDDATAGQNNPVADKCAEIGAQYFGGPKSAGLKRNLAAERAQYALLFFVDSDCLVTPGTLTAHHDRLRAAPDDVAGAVGLTEMHGEITAVWRTIEGSQFHNPCFDFAERYSQVGWGTTANISVRREVFFQAGGFSEQAYTLVGGEDVDFGFRVTNLNYRWITSIDALVLHRRSPITALTEVLQRLFTYGRADMFLSEQYPERRDFHANPFGLAGLILASTPLVGHPYWPGALIAAVLVPLLLLVCEACRRRASSKTAYGDRAQAEFNQVNTIGFFQHLKCSLIDSLFDAGIAWEAIKRLKPLRAFARFAYVDDQTFIPRRTP